MGGFLRISKHQNAENEMNLFKGVVTTASKTCSNWNKSLQKHYKFITIFVFVHKLTSLDCILKICDANDKEETAVRRWVVDPKL